MIYKGSRMCRHSGWFFYQLWKIKCFKRMRPCSTLSFIAEEIYVKVSQKVYFIGSWCSLFNLEEKLVYPLHMRAWRPIYRAYKKRFCVFKLISSQIDSLSEDSRSFRRLYLMWSAIYTTMPPPRLVSNVPCLRAARSLRSKLKPPFAKYCHQCFHQETFRISPECLIWTMNSKDVWFHLILVLCGKYWH